MARAEKPRNIGGLAVFLTSDNSGWLTGVTIPIDGGHTISWQYPFKLLQKNKAVFSKGRQMIKCAGLVHLDSTKNKILLVRVRDNELFYLAGGKIEANETPEQTLIRELAEELSIEVIPESIKHVVTITAPAYPQNDTVQLFCYTAKWIGKINILV